MTTRTPRALSARITLLISVLVALTTLASAQAGRGAISGLISNTSGAIVPGAKVTATNQATGIQAWHAVFGGRSLLLRLPPSSPFLRDPMKSWSQRKDSRQPSTKTSPSPSIRSSTINISLNVGSVSEVVSVNASTSLVETSNSTVGQLISSDVIDRVPLVTRDVFQLIQLSAGVLPTNETPNASDTSGIFNSRPGVDVSAYTINGALQGSVSYMLDGSPLGVAENNAASIMPAFQVPEDGVEEYRVETQNTPATYGSGGAGVISLVSKSGANQFHGDAFVYIRPNTLAANDYFNKLNNPGSSTPDYHRYQEGGSFSGPILHQKLFFEGDYEATQQQQFDSGGTFTVPTLAER